MTLLEMWHRSRVTKTDLGWAVHCMVPRCWTIGAYSTVGEALAHAITHAQNTYRVRA